MLGVREGLLGRGGLWALCRPLVMTLGCGRESCREAPALPPDAFDRIELVGVQPYAEGLVKGVPSSSIPLTMVLAGVKCLLEMPSLSLKAATSCSIPPAYSSCPSLPLLPDELAKVPSSGRSPSISSMIGSTETLPSRTGNRAEARRDEGEELRAEVPATLLEVVAEDDGTAIAPSAISPIE